MPAESDWLVAATPTPMTHLPSDIDLNVLLVDSQAYQQTTLLQSLARHGLIVSAVATAQEAWALIQLTPPHLILLDADLPDGSGFKLCRQLQRSPQHRGIPVLFWGEGQTPQARLQAFEVGGVDFITKPYWPEEVVVRIKLHLTQNQTQQRVKHHTRRLLAKSSDFPLLVNLQKALHQQTVQLREQNIRLQQEIRERHEIEKALRQEQQKSEQLLLNILPEAIVAQLKQFQGSLAERFEEATVLFADIVNFTPLAAHASPLDLVNLLNQVFSAFDRLAEKYHLEKIKTIGDAYMVVGGVPVSHEHHAAAVADMALEMQQVIQGFSPRGMPLQLRIGINTGTVVAGVIGIKKFSYDLWGDAVNVASRMESQGTPGKIQVTEVTYQQLLEAFQFESGQEIEVKGKGWMKTYYLLGRL
jgi:adenylate cyclase